VSNIVNLYRSDLGIGVVVGVAGIGVVLVRSVRERRRQIGMLRATGIDGRQIGWSFLLEGGFVAAQGLIVGSGLGAAMVMALARSPQIRDVLGFNPPIPLPSPSLLLLTAGVLVASLLASVVPARAASRIPPAIALRLVD
jgi:putative ABC transport system permease protein